MKKLNILKTFAINIVVISLLCAFCFPINAVNALTNYTENKENRSIETLTITADQGLGGDMGYVTCKVIVNYNIQARTYKVAGVTVTPHFSSRQPLLTMIGNPTTTPDSGGLITNGYVTVHYKFGIMFTDYKWSKSCKVYL